MLRRSGGTATTVVGLSLVVVSACSEGANGPAPAPGTLDTGTSPSSSRLPVSTASPQSTTRPEFSPASIAITSKLVRPGEVVLRVNAPRHTSFRIGQDLHASVPCGSAPIVMADPVTYGVICPTRGTGAKLVATIAYRDFDYTFVKVL